MIFIWGRKRVERKLGKVADFCPICRGIRSFELTRVGMAGHIYYVSFSEGALVGHIITCDDCRVILSAEPTRYSCPQKDNNHDLESLVPFSFPTLKSVYGDRLEIEEQLKRAPGSISGELRNDFLIEPFEMLDYQVEARFANSSELDRPAGLGCLGTVLVGGGLFFGSAALRGPAQDKMLLAAVILVVMGTVYTFVQIHLAPKRFVKVKIAPVLAQALEPLQPTQAEIEDCVKRCASLGLKIGSSVKPGDIWAELQQRALRSMR